MRILSFILIAVVLVSACSKINPMQDHVVDPYQDKASFHPNWQSHLLSPEWYYRMTVVDAPVGSKALSIGDGNWLHLETIRFEITEFYLIGWRSHSSVPGSEGESTLGGKENYKGAPVVAFKILSHFDITPNVDPMTSVRGNLIQENRDQSWYKRRFMKVDYSKNIVSELKRQDDGSWMWGSENIQRDNAFAIGQNEPANPKRSRFEDGYIEITTKQGVKTDILGNYGYYGEPFEMDSSAPVFDIRYSFMRKPVKTNYQALNYTDDLFDQFGFYRASFTGQQTWDPIRGSTEKGKNYNVTRFNIWNEDGSPKPIIYYTSVSHPRSLMAASRKVESEWNRIFKELVLAVKKDRYKNLSEVPDMWILRENSCNINNVNNLLKGDLRDYAQELSKVKLDDIKVRLDKSNDAAGDASFTSNMQEESKALDDLEKVCAAFEYLTAGKENAFRYQRAGDLRYNLLNLITKRAMTNWSGLGPMFADMQTGEIIQSTANVNLWYLDRRAQQAVDLMDMMTGKLRFRELVFGSDVHGYMMKKMKEIRGDEKLLPDSNSMLKMAQRMAKFNRKPGDNPLPNETVDANLKAIDGTLLVQKIVTGDINPINDFLVRKEAVRRQSYTVSDPPEFLDNLVTGIALQFKNEDRKKRFSRIREAVYVATMLHEVGHNMGLTHNMAGSSDALNYGKRFWEIQALPTAINMAELLKVPDPEVAKYLVNCARDSARTWRYLISPQECYRQQELMYSSIMDYHASWNADLGGLGAYDKAAIFFGYGQLVEVFPDKNLNPNAGKDLKKWIHLNDWRKIPKEFVSNVDQINERNWVSYDASHPPANQVPYRFCIDASGAYGPHCRAFDFGADMRGRASYNRTQYWQQYFLTHFSRDQIWNMKNDLSKVVSRDLQIFDDFNQIMRWYGYYMLTDDDFRNSDAAADYLAAAAMGLNHYAHVLGHPVSGEHLTTIDNPKLLEPIDQLDSCALDNIASQDDQDAYHVVPGHAYVNVELGDGRPFAIGLNNDYEDYHLSYVGSFYAKLAAGYFLASPGGQHFPKTDSMKDSKMFRMSWYRLFPEEVLGLFSNMIRSEWSEVGPLVNPQGELVHRDVIDPVTLKKPDYTGHTPVMPAVADMLPYRSLYYTTALLSIPQDTETNPIYSLQIGQKGARDDIRALDVEFSNPFNGEQYWAKKLKSTSISYDYLVKLNTLKKKMLDLETCSKANNCICLKTRHEGSCCSASNPKCKTVTQITCSAREAALKLEQSKVDLNNAIGFADDMRAFYNLYTHLR